MSDSAFERAFVVVLHVLGEPIRAEAEPFASFSCQPLVRALARADRRAALPVVLPELMRLGMELDKLALR